MAYVEPITNMLRIRVGIGCNLDSASTTCNGGTVRSTHGVGVRNLGRFGQDMWLA